MMTRDAESVLAALREKGDGPADVKEIAVETALSYRRAWAAMMILGRSPLVRIYQPMADVGTSRVIIAFPTGDDEE